MKVSLYAGVAFSALVAFAASANAADLPRRTQAVAPAPIAVPMFTWTGFYAGLNGGYAFGDFTKAGKQFVGSPKGAILGGQVGYNQQIGNFVVGLEGDLNWVDAKDSSGNGVFTGRGKVQSLATVRGRAGVAVDRALFFATAGYAGGSVKADLTTPALNYSEAKWLNGYAIGAGIEYAVTNNVTVKGEYLYSSLEGKNYWADQNVKTGVNLNTVRAGVNYKF